MLQYFLIMVIADAPFASARLTLVATDSYLYNTNQPKIDRALYEANGRKWYVDNILFNKQPGTDVKIFFAPGDVLAIMTTARYTDDFFLGIKKAIDLLADRGEMLDVLDVSCLGEETETYLSDRLNDYYDVGFRYLFFIRWNTGALFGKLNPENINKICMSYINLLDKYPPSYINKKYMDEYLESCRKNGVRPISDDHTHGRDDYTDADIDHYLKCRFKTLDFYNIIPEIPRESHRILEYGHTELYNRTFKYLDRKKLDKKGKNMRMDSSISADEPPPSLTLAVCPVNSGINEKIRTECKINLSLYEANGRDWYVEYILLGPRERTQLYFPKTDDFSCLTSMRADSIFINGLINGIDRLAENGDTLYISVEGWIQPCDNQTQDETAIEEWIEHNRIDYLINTDWKTRIKSGSRALQIFGDEDICTYGLSEFHLWPRLDDGTKESHFFRAGYEKACIDRELNMIKDAAIFPDHIYTDADIDLYLEWNIKKWNYYRALSGPIEKKIINNYNNSRDIRLYDILWICKQ